MRLAKHSQPRTVLSLAGFSFGTSSAMFGLCCILMGGLHLYNPPLFRIYQLGIVLAVVGLVFSIVGIWQKNTLRWLAPILSLSMILLWRVLAIDVTWHSTLKQWDSPY
jgi:hypothetical protein